MQTITNLCRPIEGPRIREALEHAYTRLFRDYTNAIGEVVKYYRDIERDRCNAEQAEKIKKDSIEIPKPAKKGRRASNLQEVMNHSNMRLLVNFSERRRQQVSETKAIRKDADRDLPPNMGKTLSNKKSSLSCLTLISLIMIFYVVFHRGSLQNFDPELYPIPYEEK